MSKFIGRRIVPKHDGVWDINKEYEELSIVLDKASGESYISRRPVPVGTAISDEIYWMQYSLYSAQIAEAVKEMEDTEARLIQYVDTAESNMNSRVNSAESLTNSNKAELNSRMDTLDKRLDEAITKDKLEKDIQKRLTAGINDLLGLNLSDNPLERIRNDAGLMTVFRHVGCIGDSLASGEAVYKKADGTTGGKDLFEYSWGQYLARMTGNTYYNWSKGGLRCDTFLSSSLATECFDGNHKCEAYIIGLGQNENNRKYKIGTVEDINLGDYTQNPDTYYGNYGKIIQKIQEMQPKAKIFILTDPLKSVENAGYNSAVREIAGIFKSVYLVDLYTYGTALYNSGFLYQQKRGGHYNAVGYFICAMIISTYIDWIMKKNPNEFREIEFIGLDNKFY